MASPTYRRADRDVEIFWYAETAGEIWKGICDWYEKAGEDLIECPLE